MKLSKTQERALEKLRNLRGGTNEWSTAYALQESVVTLNSLSKLGLIRNRKSSGVTLIWPGWERTSVEFQII